MKNSRVRYKGGKREDLDNIYFRSSTESNYARYLKFLKIEFLHESRTFYFPKIKRGNISYMPDFYLPKEDRWVEVKGYFDPPSKTKLKRFKKYYPQYFEKLIIVVGDMWGESKSAIQVMKFLDELGVPPARIESYKEIEEKLGGLILGWE